MYVRPHLDYADIIYHIPYKDNPAFLSENTEESLNILMQKIESVQYDAALSSTGAWRGSPRKKLYEDLGWESLNLRRELRRLCMYHEILTLKQPTYLYSVINDHRPSTRSRGVNAFNLRSFHHRTDSFALSLPKINGTCTYFGKSHFKASCISTCLGVLEIHSSPLITWVTSISLSSIT